MTREQSKQEEQTGRQRENMHSDVESWDDTCSCEPEARWQEAGEALQREQEAENEQEEEDDV